MTIPDDVRERVSFLITDDAERNDWMALPSPEKSRMYSAWAQEPGIGGVLLGFMSMSQVHRYIKDTLIKTYAQRKISDPATALNLLGIGDEPRVKTFEKPPGVMLEDRRIVAWHAAKNWKTTLFAVYERAYGTRDATPYGAVLFEAEGKFADATFRHMVDDIATRLGVERVVWNPL